MNIVHRLEDLRAREHAATVSLIEALVELDRTEEHLRLGYSGVWDFLSRHLHYSNAAASRRHKAMKCAKKFPEVLAMLRSHETNLSALAMAESTLTSAADARELLGEIRGKSQREVERVVALRNPVAPKRETVRRVAVRPVAPAGESLFTSATEAPEERVFVSFSLKPHVFDRVEEARSIASRKLPKGVSMAQLFEEMLDFYLKAKAPRAVRSAKRPSRDPRHVPAAVRDEVFRRDGGCCSYVGPDGVRCGSRHDLEVDHVKPFALGGRSEAANLRLLCAKHNRWRARQTFGEGQRTSR